MIFDIAYAGAMYGMTNGREYDLRPDGRFASAWIQDQYTQVTLTGYKETGASGNTGYQTTSGGFIFPEEGWEYKGVASVMKYSQSQAQALVDKITQCNKQIIANNLLCARYANKLTPEQRSLVRDLQYRLDERNKALQAGGLTTNIQTGYPEGYAELAPYMDKLMAGEEAIGVATWVIIVVACVVVTSLSTAAYYAYRYMASEAEKDVKFSKELTAVLAQKLTPEEYQMLMDETKGIVTKSRIKQAISSSSMTWIAAAMVVGGLLIYTKFIKRQ